MEKLILLVDDLTSAQSVVDTLHELGITDEAISALANEHTPLDALPAAELEDESDAVPAFKRGIAIGGSAGLLLGVAALAFPPLGIVAGGTALAAGAAGGATFGAFASALIGVSVPHSQLDDYESAIQAGKVLLIVDVEEKQVETVSTAVSERHSTVDVKGTADFLPPVV